MKLTHSRTLLHCIGLINEELSKKDITFRPPHYFSDCWGCPNKVPIIGIPFTYCSPIFDVIEEDHCIDVQPILKILRHETGHALCYAYRLYKERGWKYSFGNFNKPYLKGKIKLVPGSKNFVSYLPDYEGCYAAVHPDEDFAETFAVWLDPNSNWKEKYRLCPGAMSKLLYVDVTMEMIGEKKPLVTNGSKHLEYKTMTLR